MCVSHIPPIFTKAELLSLESDPFYQILCKAQIGKKKRAFLPSEVMTIYQKLCEPKKNERKRMRDLVLFTLGIDMMWRCSDILKTKVCDVVDSTDNTEAFLSQRQKKTKHNTGNALMPSTQAILTTYIKKFELEPNDYLFAGRFEGTHLCDRQHRDIVKEFASLAGVATEYYSTHSMRKTKSVLIYMINRDPAIIMHCLGQKSLNSALSYLGVEKAHAIYASQRIDFFDMSVLYEHGILENEESNYTESPPN